ncbi:hypothetical protein D3C84_857560 [compost metagenome]
MGAIGRDADAQTLLLRMPDTLHRCLHSLVGLVQLDRIGQKVAPLFGQFDMPTVTQEQVETKNRLQLAYL